MILYRHNKTAYWLAKKTQCEKDKLFRSAQQMSNKVKQEFLARQKEIDATRRAEAEEAIKKTEEQQKKKQISREDLTTKIEELGYWNSHKEVDSSLAQMKKVADKVKALKLQLKYRQEIIGQVAPKQLFIFSANIDGHRSILKWPQLADNLKSLISQSEGYSSCWVLLISSPV
jgi:hypothetical protein